MIIRALDKWGSGYIGSSRGDHLHRGFDLPVGTEGSLVLSDVSGIVSKIGSPYPLDDPQKGVFRYVQVTDSNGYDLRYFYVKPCVREGAKIDIFDPLGTAQGALMAEVWPGMTPHVHFEVKRGNEFLHPLKFLAGKIEFLTDEAKEKGGAHA